MAPTVRIDAALQRLSVALDQLEASSERLARSGAEKRDLADTLAVMQDDRGRLANDLDAAMSRSRLLEHATAEVASRLRGAGGTLRRLLAETDGATRGGLA